MLGLLYILFHLFNRELCFICLEILISHDRHWRLIATSLSLNDKVWTRLTLLAHWSLLEISLYVAARGIVIYKLIPICIGLVLCRWIDSANQ